MTTAKINEKATQSKIQQKSCKKTNLINNYEKIDKMRLNRYLDIINHLDFIRKIKHNIEKIIDDEAGQDKEKHTQRLAKLNEEYALIKKEQEAEYNRLYPNIFRLRSHYDLKMILNRYFESMSYEDIVHQEFYNYPDYNEVCFKTNSNGEKVYIANNKYRKKIEKWLDNAFKFYEKDYIKTLKSIQ